MARFYNNIFLTVREFRPGFRVIKCKAKVVKPRRIGGRKTPRTRPPVTSAATAEEFEQKGETRMKKTYTIIALLVLVGSMAVAAQAQTSSRTELRATIPFQFNVGNKQMPAGDYTVTPINPSSDRVVLRLRSKDGHTSLIQMDAVTGKAKEGARLVFNRYGSFYFFAQAWTSGDANGLQASKSRSERAQQEIANMRPVAETVALMR